MALQKKRKPSRLSRMRARLKTLTQKLKTRKRTMAFSRRRFRRFRFRNPFRRFRRSFRRRSYRSSGGFSNRVPIIGFRMPSLFIWLAVIGGGIFFFKNQLKPLWDKITNHTS